MITQPQTTEPGASERPATTPGTAGVAAEGTRAAPTVADARAWLWRFVAGLAVVTGVLVVTGLLLTFGYRPASRLDEADVGARPLWVGAAQVMHSVSAYAFVVLVCLVVGSALLLASRRNHTPGSILASGFGLFFVALGFLLTGYQLAWRGFVWIDPAFRGAFEGIVGFPRAVQAVLVGGRAVNPARYETIAWIHIAGLPVFAVFAAWWLLGAIQASRRSEAVARPTPSPVAPPGRAEPGRTVTLAEQLFGTDDPERVRLQVDAFLERHLGCGIAALDFTRSGTVIVLGVTLHDGRPVVVRCFPPGADVAHLRAVQDVQAHLVGQGFPAPQPLLPPSPFGVGVATVEGRLFAPPPADPADEGTRRALAEGLAVFVRASAPLARLPDLAGRGPQAPPASGSVFPVAPGAPYDAAATTRGAEWIEDLGARARWLLDAAPPAAPVVGHFAWSVEHVALAGGHLVGVFDWRRVGTAPEAVVLGSAAHQFTVDRRAPAPRLPTTDEIREFVADYERARGVALTTPERVAARAAYLFCTAMAARDEHARAMTGQPTSSRFRDRLATIGPTLLA